jgi:molybdopterin synthase catalytic subunit
MIRIVEKEINAADLLAAVTVPEAGGIDLFLGTTRNHSKGKKVVRLEYEAYGAMAIKIMREIENEMMKRWPLHKVAIVHRTGIVPVMEASVGIAVSAAHRSDAFEACRYAIDELKKRVPIWKKEIFEDGEVWVENAEAKKSER